MASAAIAATPQRAPSKPTVSIPWIVASEEIPWSSVLAAPVAAHVRRSDSTPLVMTITSPPTREAEWLMSVASGPRPILLVPSSDTKIGTALKKRSPEVLQIGRDPSAASALVAKRFWSRAPAVVMAAADDPEGLILGGALAAALGRPLLISDRDAISPEIASALKDLSVERMIVAVCDGRRSPGWVDRLEVAAEILRPQMLEHRLVTALSADSIHNVVVARVPEDRAEVGNSAWLASYASFARSAAVVLTHAPGPAVAEADVRALIARESLRPRTVTVLADYASIGYRLVEIDPPPPVHRPEPPAPPVLVVSSGTLSVSGGSVSLFAGSTSLAGTVSLSGGSAGISGGTTGLTCGPSSISSGTAALSSGTAAVATAIPAPERYTVRAEPFVITQSDQLAALGVGRIPLESLGDASVFFARGLLRDRLLVHRPSRLLMIANCGSGRTALPLCETMSRNTASEFKNFGVHVDEFYGTPPQAPAILTAAQSAQLILYEGHLLYQDLIDPPIVRRSLAQNYPLDQEDLEGIVGPIGGSENDAMPMPRVVAAEPTSQHLQGPLEGFPIVVLQSCESLDDAVLWRLDELGGAALIGSMTPIHSGCGSDLLNAAMTSLLYRGGTLGETLRDAQNFMFCVEELKARRGHKEMAKGVRVAMSFRLWGDPELQVFPMGLSPPQQSPVRAEWIGSDTLRIHMPDSRLPEARSEKYVANMFPNSQGAGLVKIQDDSMKRILPFYSFCVPLPERLAKSGATQLEPPRIDARRVNARIDRSRGLLYLVYYPDQENPGESVDLRLKAPPNEPGRRLAK
jgi:hypothetical protein